MGMSKNAFAKKAGVTQRAIAKWERRGTSKAQAGVLFSASRNLGVPLEDLVDEEVIS